MSLEKAYLTFLEPSAEGNKPAGSATVNGRSKLEFQFNPKEYTVKKSADWGRTSTPGAKETSAPQFKGSGPRKLSLELFFDRTETGDDVTGDVDTLFACLTPLPKVLQADKPAPPFVRFGWGGKVFFVAFLTSVNAKFTLFKPNGTPIRAVCGVTLEEFPVEDGKQNPTSGGLAALRTHTAVAGDTLHSIAYREYGNPGRWRLLAEENGIDDPFRLAAGTDLRIPMADTPGTVGAGPTNTASTVNAAGSTNTAGG